MSLNRQTSRIVVRSLGLRLPSGERIEQHRHDWHQLVYATEGAMTVATPIGQWVVPPERAVWLPEGFEHSLGMTGSVRMRTIYIAPDLEVELPTECCVVHVSPLLRELVLETVRLGMLDHAIQQHRHLAWTLTDQITATREVPLKVRVPTDPRARAVADRARADLAATHSIGDLARGCGASARTVERLFVKETGLTFGRWLQRVRMLHALERLAVGDSVTSASLAVGYDSTSAFIATFKRALGTTPGKYFEAAPSAAPPT